MIPKEFIVEWNRDDASPRFIRRVKRMAWLALVLACAVVFSGCGRASLNRSETDGEMVLYRRTSRIRTFDPVRAGDVASSRGIAKVYEGLVQYAYLKRPYQVEPCLAAAMPEITPDGLAYTFRLRPGVFFQDDPCFTATNGKGRELTADDFVYSIKRVADKKQASSGFWAFQDRIVGLDDFREASGGDEKTDYSRPVDGLQAVDRYTLKIQLREPYPQLLWVLAMHYAFAVPQEAVTYYGDEFSNHPVGTGPYILRKYRPNYSYEFVRNPKWLETGRKELYPEPAAMDDRIECAEDAHRRMPFIDRIVEYVIGDSTTEWLMFLAGQLDYTVVGRDEWSAVVNDRRELNDALAQRGIRLLSSPGLDLYYIGFNMDDPVVGRNLKLRQAMTCAFNSEEWCEFYQQRVVRPTGPLPPGVAGYEDAPSPFPFDLERAGKLLEEAGFPNGIDPATGRRLQLTLELGSADNAEVRQSAELFASFMARLGLVIQLSFNNWPTFLDKMDRRQAQLFSLGWVADYPDGENFLQLFYGPNASPGPNHCNYARSAFDRLYERIRSMADGPERTALFREMSGMVVQDCPMIFTSLPVSYGLFHPWVRNFKFHDFPYGMVKYHKIDAELRRRTNMSLKGAGA